MAEPIKIPQANHCLKPAPGDEDRVSDLWTWHKVTAGGGDQFMSTWRLTPDEMLEVLRTGLVHLFVLGGHPPVRVTGTSPFPAVQAIELPSIGVPTAIGKVIDAE